MLNAIGLANVGVEAFVAKKLPALRRFRHRRHRHVLWETVEEYAEWPESSRRPRASRALELNISCPNTEKGGASSDADPDGTSACGLGRPEGLLPFRSS